MKNNFICFVEFVTDIEKGFKFLENFINIETKIINNFNSFPPSRKTQNKGFIDFNAYKKLSNDIEDELQILNWRERNWGCVNIPYLEKLNIDIRDYYCCEDHYDCIANVDIFNKTEQENDNDVTWKINWFNEHCDIEYCDKHINEIFKIIKDECKKGVDKKDQSDYVMTIKLMFLIDNIPFMIFEHWKNNYHEYSWYSNLEVGFDDDECGFNIELISFDDYVIKYRFTDNGYKYEEIIGNEDPREFYRTVLKRNCLNKNKVFAEIRGKLNELIKDNNKLKYDISELTLQIEKALYSLEDDPETVVEIIVITNKLYDDYLKNLEN